MEETHIWAKVVREQSTEESIWTYAGESDTNELRDDDLHNLYTSTNIIMVFRSGIVG